MGKTLCECNSSTLDHEQTCPAYTPVDKIAMDRSLAYEEARADMRVQNTYWLLNRAKKNTAVQNGTTTITCNCGAGPFGVHKRWCEVAKPIIEQMDIAATKCDDCGRDLNGYAGPLCRYCEGTSVD